MFGLVESKLRWKPKMLALMPLAHVSIQFAQMSVSLDGGGGVVPQPWWSTSPTETLLFHELLPSHLNSHCGSFSAPKCSYPVLFKDHRAQCSCRKVCGGQKCFKCKNIRFNNETWTSVTQRRKNGNPRRSELSHTFDQAIRPWLACWILDCLQSSLAKVKWC